MVKNVTINKDTNIKITFKKENPYIKYVIEIQDRVYPTPIFGYSLDDGLGKQISNEIVGQLNTNFFNNFTGLYLNEVGDTIFFKFTWKGTPYGDKPHWSIYLNDTLCIEDIGLGYGTTELEFQESSPSVVNWKYMDDQIGTRSNRIEVKFVYLYDANTV